MATTTDTEISQLVFNKLSKAQYDDLKAKGQINENEFYITPDLNNGGGGFEVGDIGIAILPIDESENRRRYLNGQTIVQSQFPTFSTKVKTAVLQYPNLGTTESNWQAEVTNSKLGQCGKFVIDNTAGTIRLPKVVNINGLSNLNFIGNIKTESLPDHIHGQYSRQEFASGAANFANTNDPTRFSANGYGFGVYNNSTYKEAAPVQQEAIQYPYFIQVASGVEETIDTSKEIELNNPFSLFDTKWSDHLLDNLSWIRSDTFEWQSGTIYQSAYQKLIEEYNNAASITKEDHYIENFRRVGTVKVNEYIASNFSVDNYLVLNTNFFGGTADWEFNTEFTTTINGTHQEILSTTIPYSHIDFYIGTDNKLHFDSYLNNTSTKRAEISTAKILSNNTTYTVKIGYNLAAKKYYISFLDPDTNTYIEDASVSNADVVSSPTGQFLLGIDTGGTDKQLPFLGAINLGKTYFSRAELTDGNLYQYSISYKLSPNNYKITDISNETLLTTIFNEVGVAYYYLLDTTNSQFKLPRTKWGFVGTRNSGGNFVEESLPNIAGQWARSSSTNENTTADSGTFNGAFYQAGTIGTRYQPGNSSSTYAGTSQLGFDASLSSPVYQDDAPVQQRSTEMYLYFYVGEAVQGANLINMESTLQEVVALKKDTLKTNQITNCITEIPQDIKLEIINGTLTLKAGSKVYIPNGFEADGITKKFDSKIIENDISVNYGTGRQVCPILVIDRLELSAIDVYYSGTTQPTGVWWIWYDTSTNKIKWYNGSTITEGCAFPLGLVTENAGSGEGAGVKSIDQIFNGFGFIGSTVFALPDVKFQGTYGKDNLGKYNIVEYTLSSVETATMTGFSNWRYWAGIDCQMSENGIIPTYFGFYSNRNIVSETKPNITNINWYNPLTGYSCYINTSGEIELQNKGVISIRFAEINVVDNKIVDWNIINDTTNILNYWDKPTISTWSMPSTKSIDLSLGTSDTSYTAPANGYFICRKHAAAIGQFVAIENLDNKMMSWDVAQYSNNEMRVWLPVVKGQKIMIEYNAAGTLDYFRFIYAEGEV